MEVCSAGTAVVTLTAPFAPCTAHARNEPRAVMPKGRHPSRRGGPLHGHKALTATIMGVSLLGTSLRQRPRDTGFHRSRPIAHISSRPALPPLRVFVDQPLGILDLQVAAPPLPRKRTFTIFQIKNLGLRRKSVWNKTCRRRDALQGTG